jgi:hypothetical protein
VVVLFGFSIYQCGQPKELPQKKSSGIESIQIPLKGDIAKRGAELSGLSWYKDQLIILPQYPDRFSEGNYSSMFKIPKKDILDYLDLATPSPPLSVKRIVFDEKEIPERIPWFQGYESIVFVENRVYLSIEINQKRAMQALLVEGTVSDNLEKIILDEASLDSLPMPLQLGNYSYEAMVHVDGELLVFYEANGVNLTNSPKMIKVDLEIGDISRVPFLNLEYRITDATNIDENGFFWVSNYFWPGDYIKLNPGVDPLADKSDPPMKFSKDKGIERLIEMQYSENKIRLSDQKPIVLASRPDGESRNWEGIVRLDDRGFLLVTDKHPETILAFVPFKQKN